MTALSIGYARVSTDAQDLTAQRDGLPALGVDSGRIYVDHGLTGTNRERPGLREALAACREGDTLVVTKLDRLARSLPDARAIAEELTRRQVRLSLGGSVYDPHNPVGRLLCNVLAKVAEFEADLIRLRTREGMRVANAVSFTAGERMTVPQTEKLPVRDHDGDRLAHRVARHGALSRRRFTAAALARRRRSVALCRSSRAISAAQDAARCYRSGRRLSRQVGSCHGADQPH
ncbi:Site-specific DNA recombinase [Geodermatophilus africanus]|uniref:Site-specific DNA recombinase n=1 Tax=Geodermatophilus africanus TaxID=1137993 RepID=A0A1H3J8N8_9ACTN|nr:recombinase family protein [Geodermatophilus africanus]SDY35788.1 Site-specific DNA recombinase [Geodermatophilus africanus]